MFKEIPKNINSKFFNYPSIVPDTMCSGFMPKDRSQIRIEETEAWCAENLGSKNQSWTRRSHYFFTTPDDAFAFKLRWC
jgi:hypothetical protein